MQCRIQIMAFTQLVRAYPLSLLRVTWQNAFSTPFLNAHIAHGRTLLYRGQNGGASSSAVKAFRLAIGGSFCGPMLSFGLCGIGPAPISGYLRACNDSIAAIGRL